MMTLRGFTPCFSGVQSRSIAGGFGTRADAEKSPSNMFKSDDQRTPHCWRKS